MIAYYPPHSPGVPWVGRVAAIGGDSIEIRAGVLHVNGVALDAPYVDTDALCEPVSRELAEQVVPADGLFMLGDNRDNAHDSRYWGPASADAVVGRVTWIFYSTDGSRIGRVE